MDLLPKPLSSFPSIDNSKITFEANYLLEMMLNEDYQKNSNEINTLGFFDYLLFTLFFF